MKQKSQKGLYSHWEKIYNHQQYDFRASSLQLLVQSFLNKKQDVLDLGCGTGSQTLFLAKNGFNATGVDESNKMLEMAKAQAIKQDLTSVSFYHASIDDLAKKNKAFSQIICLDVIEHIKDDDTALKTIYSLLTNNGKLILSVPAHQYLYGPKDEKIGHYRRYSKASLYKKITGAGFIIEKIRYWNFIGYLITIISLKIFHRPVDEDFRKTSGIVAKLKQSILKKWFIYVENNISFPIGLSLFIVAKKLNKI